MTKCEIRKTNNANNTNFFLFLTYTIIQFYFIQFAIDTGVLIFYTFSYSVKCECRAMCYANLFLYNSKIHTNNNLFTFFF